MNTVKSNVIQFPVRTTKGFTLPGSTKVWVWKKDAHVKVAIAICVCVCLAVAGVVVAAGLLDTMPVEAMTSTYPSGTYLNYK